MKKVLMITAGILLITGLALYFFHDPLQRAAYAKLTENMFVQEDRDAFNPGPVVGSHFPGLRALYQGREISLLNEFVGVNGTVLLASRSFDWCPYCMRQMIQLQASRGAYDAAGIGLLAITYDDPGVQQVFIDRFQISIPILSDIEALSFKTLGILNDTYQQGDRLYGIPHPGMIVVNPENKVVGKLFLENYSVRVDALAALAFARERLMGQ